MARSVAEIGLRATLDAAPVYRTAAEMGDKIAANVGKTGGIARGAGSGLLRGIGAAGFAGVVSGGTAAVVGAAFSAITSGAEMALDAVTGLAGGVFRLFKGTAEGGLEMDRLRNSITQVTGSAETANEVLDRLSNLSARGGGNIEHLVNLNRSFLSNNQSPALALQNTEAVAGVSRIYRADIERTGIALTQMLGKGKVMAEELRGQLLEAGIPLTFFTEQLGITTDQFWALQDAERLTGETLLWAFRRATAEGGKFSTALDDAGKTAAGSWDLILGKLDLLRQRIGLSLITTISGAAGGLGADFNPEEMAARFDKWFKNAEGSLRQIFNIGQDIWNLTTGLLGLGQQQLGSWDQIEQALKRVRGYIPDIATGAQKVAVGFAESARWLNIIVDRAQMFYDIFEMINPTLLITKALVDNVGKFGQSGIRPGHKWAREVDAELRDFLSEQRGQDWGAFARKAIAETDRQNYLRRNEPPPARPAPGMTGPEDWRKTLRGQDMTGALKPRGPWEEFAAAVTADRAGRSIESGRGVMDAFKKLQGGGQHGQGAAAAGYDARGKEYADKLSAAMNRSISGGQAGILDTLKSALRIAQQAKQVEDGQLDALRKIADREPVVFQPPAGIVFKGAGGAAGGK